MPMLEKYRHYFDIDPDYFPAVNEAVINKNPEMWKKFFPHETFIKLIKNTVDVLSRKQKMCLWVEGAYGTGKSHAVLTLKKLLDAGEEDTRAYFQRYSMDSDLCNRFQSVKNSGRILTVHRYGSATIRGDHNLIFAIQESVEKALTEAGIENKGGNALKEATVEWLSDRCNRDYFNALITGAYADLFGGDDVDAVINKLKTFSGDALAKVMDDIFKVADERQIKMLSLSTAGLCSWLREIIKANELKAIVFIWDEFTEYFKNNARNLTGFQELCELSETEPFYFILVTHLTQGLFYERDKDFIKLNDRFVKPHCLISLPENIAFQLMGAAMEKNKDSEVAADWQDVLGDLIDRTKESRKLVKNVAHISDQEMVGILPIHPYAALLLKHISAAFDSNQRSMFDFIKNDRGDEIKGFQWFIDKLGPEDENPLLTVDMLWEFFYDKGKDYLAHDIRSILDYYNRAGNKSLIPDQKRVLKTVLLLQAISQYAGDSVELFIPNARNIDNAFEGTDLDGSASRCAAQLVRDKVLFEKPLGAGKSQYAAYNNEGEIDTRPFEEQIDKRSTSALITEELTDKTRIVDAVTLAGALKLRYELRYVSSMDFESTIRQLRNTEEKYVNKIVAVVCFAKDDSESVLIGKKIHEALEAGTYNMIFIDASSTPFGADGYACYRLDMARSMAQQGKDNDLAKQYANNAKDSLKKWKSRIAGGEFVVYTAAKRDGERAITLDNLYEILGEINKKKFPECLESVYNVIENMYTPSNMKQGVECACNQKTSGTFRSGSKETQLEKALDGAWNVDKYWDVIPYLHISKIKRCVDGFIDERFHNEGGRVSIRQIFDVLKAAPYGFMPCNLSAFMLGFILKEYTDGTYSWSDGLQNDILNVNKLKEMIDEAIRLEITPNPRYRDKYIVSMTPKEKAFNELTAAAFAIPLNMCTSVPNTRERIRSKMKEYAFPLWTVQSLLATEALKTDTTALAKLIDLYCGIANSNNMGAAQSDSDIAMSIGELAMANPTAAEDLKKLFCKEKCMSGMAQYLKSFDDGALVSLAGEIDDGGQYINVLRKKFDADAANWVWNIETAQQKIREVILEYKIIAESNKIISKNISLEDTVREWCDKCGYIRIACVAAKKELGELGSFLDILFNVKKAGTLLDSQKQKFLELLQASGEAFRSFYTNQVDVFKRVCNFYLDGISDEEIKEVFDTLPAGAFTYDRKEYFDTVEAKVKAYKEGLKSTKLKNMWREKTGTATPRAWSKQHGMPILCLVPDSEIGKARAAFAAVNRSKSDEATIDKALEYFATTHFFDLLSDERELDKAFREVIIKSYAVMLTDIQEVKDYLDSHITAEPFEWFGLPEVDKKLQQMAEAKYNQGGCDRALAKIDEMGITDVKKYLKELIRDNMVVGMEIIKGN
ncbi:hypothetical protein [uncultured Phascolarctobacterium sp.]|uniref:hypothetical protein n=1 Tax=uncultured Phascolarctobacterium sp. TaxID=512296 RepID=UPI0025F19A80|nr:hypothetical protein [uncultured Phascolarctobacterium sp.]